MFVKQDSGDVPKVACINCSLKIPATSVRQHLEICCKDDELLVQYYCVINIDENEISLNINTTCVNIVVI